VVYLGVLGLASSGRKDRVVRQDRDIRNLMLAGANPLDDAVVLPGLVDFPQTRNLRWPRYGGFPITPRANRLSLPHFRKLGGGGKVPIRMLRA